MRLLFIPFLILLIAAYFYFVVRDNPIPAMRRWLKQIPAHDWSYYGLPIILSLVVIFIAVSYLSFAFHTHEEYYLSYIATPLAAFFFSALVSALLQASFISEFAVIFATAKLISLPVAVTLILGGNFGTCITNTIVSFLSFNEKDKFSRAFAASIVHDLFNITMILLVLPLEITTRFFSDHVESVARFFGFNRENMLFHFVPTDPGGNPSNPIFAFLAVAAIIGGILMIVVCVRRLFLVRLEQSVKEKVFTSRLKSVQAGVAFTFLLQSSSISTSMIVPMVANQTVSLWKAFHFMLGCNMGTAFITIFISLPIIFSGSVYGTAAALSHLLFNFYGVVLFLAIPLLANAICLLANSISEVVSLWSRKRIIVTLTSFYYGVPGAMFIFCHLIGV